MAPSKRATSKKPAGARKTATSRGRGSRRSKPVKQGYFASKELTGLLLLAVGGFLSAAFLTGRGALLGEVGRTALTHLLGVAGLYAAPIAALTGLLIMLGRISKGRILGLGLLLIAASMTLAAALPDTSLFNQDVYPSHGGIIGSALYAGIQWAAGTVGAVVVLSLLYAAGLYLLVGANLPKTWAAARWAARQTNKVVGRLRRRLTRKRVAVVTSAQKAPKVKEPEQPAPNIEPLPEFTVVLPKQSEHAGLEESKETVLPGEYTPPPFSLLSQGKGEPEHDAEGTSRRLTKALAELGVEAKVVRAVVGPRVTRYELILGSGVKVGKIRNLQQDIAYALAATEVRILAPIPGKSAVGVEVPNTKAALVTLGDVLQEYPAGNDWSLPVGLGKDISGRAVFIDLAEMPHLLIAGTTGSGKSVMLNALLTSLLLTTDPKQVKMVLIDPKRVELSYFARVPHLITPVVTDVKRAAHALVWAVSEMDRRYEVLEGVGARSLEGYNSRSETPMPYIVIVIDELADLMMTAAAKVEDAVIRIAQKARAVGIHLIVATQRPSVDVITGMIKANIPSRIAFAVSSQVDSRVILDGPGAEALLGGGDMLFKPVTALRTSRIQGAYISEREVEKVVSACAERASQRFMQEVIQPQDRLQNQEEPDDDLLQDAASFVVSTQQASVSAVQRRFRVGYSRAGRIIDALERKGVVGPHEGSKSRSVIATEHDLGHIFGEEGSAKL